MRNEQRNELRNEQRNELRNELKNEHDPFLVLYFSWNLYML